MAEGLHGPRYRAFPETATNVACADCVACTVEAWTNRAMTSSMVGGGAAGLSAALVLGRARRRVAVVDGGAPRNAPAAHMQGFLSRDGMSPADLLAAGRAEVPATASSWSTTRWSTIEAGLRVRACRRPRPRGAADPRLPPASTTNCLRSPASASGGGGISCTARTATAGRSRPAPRRSRHRARFSPARAPDAPMV